MLPQISIHFRSAPDHSLTGRTSVLRGRSESPTHRACWRQLHRVPGEPSSIVDRDRGRRFVTSCATSSWFFCIHRRMNVVPTIPVPRPLVAIERASASVRRASTRPAMQGGWKQRRFLPPPAEREEELRAVGRTHSGLVVISDGVVQGRGLHVDRPQPEELALGVVKEIDVVGADLG
jgi:hypothetical protein